MINDPEASAGAPNPQEYKWNGNEIAVPGMTCGEAATFMTNYVSNYRLLEGAKQRGGYQEYLVLLMSLLDMHRKGVYSLELPKELSMDKAEEGLKLAVTALAYGIISSSTSVSAQDLFRCADTAMQVAVQKGEEQPDKVKSGALHYGVRPNQDGIGVQVGCKIVSPAELLENYKANNPDVLVEPLKIIEELEDGQPGNN